MSGKMVAIPEGAQKSLRLMLAQRQQLEQRLQLYIRALQDVLDIHGDDWVIELDSMAFVQQSSNGVEPNVVGATASYSEGE